MPALVPGSCRPPRLAGPRWKSRSAPMARW